MSLQSSFRAVGRRARLGDGKIAAALILAVGLLVVQTGFGHSLLRAAGISRPPASFVELYFPDARGLPSALPASRRLTVQFAMGNRASERRSFVWEITEGPLRLASGRSVVSPNRTVVVAQTVRVACARARTQLLVSLARSSARLSLWLACPS